MEQGMTRSKMHATEEQRGGRMEARESRHTSMIGARSSGEQAKEVEQEMRGSKVHASWESEGGECMEGPQSSAHVICAHLALESLAA